MEFYSLILELMIDPPVPVDDIWPAPELLTFEIAEFPEVLELDLLLFEETLTPR